MNDVFNWFCLIGSDFGMGENVCKEYWEGGLE